MMVVGDVFTNRAICDAFGVGIMGGMRSDNSTARPVRVEMEPSAGVPCSGHRQATKE